MEWLLTSLSWPFLPAFRRRQFRMTYQEKGSNSSISPWHDIPIKLNETDGVLYMRVVVEIPKGETAKVETWVSSHSMAPYYGMQVSYCYRPFKHAATACSQPRTL